METLKTDDPQQPATPTREESFDARAVKLSRAFAHRLCKELPELQSVGLVFSWKGALNKAAPACVWECRSGPVESHDLEAIIGSLEQTAKFVHLQLVRALECASLMLEVIQKEHAPTREQPQSAEGDGSPGAAE